MSDSPKRVVVITGAGSGIGRELALQAVRAGYAVLAVTRHQEHLDELVRDLVGWGEHWFPMTIDITAPGAAQRIAAAAQQHFGRIDVIINNAGFATAGRILEQTDAQIDEQWQVHVAAPIRIMRAAWPLLRQSGGQVFFTGSGLARVPSPYYGAYCGAKAAVRAIVTQLRRELHGTGVAVTYIDPGSVRTGFAKTAGIETLGPAWVAASPERVAARILRAIEKRPKTVNAVWWHTLLAMLGEWFHGMTDRSMRSMPEPKNPIPAPAPPSAAVEASVPVPPKEADFERALEPVSRRMERVKLSPLFLAELLQPGARVELADAAMRWAGMPNKNERAALSEALDALAAGGFLERTGDETWRVVRSAR
jgi:short-subunit dehydrogenase